MLLTCSSGIDTEGDNQWSAEARLHQTFENIYALPPLHALFRRHGVRPTYLITYPVATDPRSAEVLRALLARQATAKSAPITTPGRRRRAPTTDVRRHPYALRCRPSQFDAQVATLTDAIDEAVGERPVSYRSGRFGFSAAHVSTLERAGYLVESSVAPLFYEAHKGGPDFVGRAARAVLPRVRRRRPCRARATCWSCRCRRRSTGACRRLLERLYARAPRPYTTKRVLRKLGIARVHVAAAVVFVVRRHVRARPPHRRRTACRCST